MWDTMVRSKIDSVTPKEAVKRVESGEWVVVDVRPVANYDEASAEGAVNVPLFQALDFSKAGPREWLKAAAYAVNGVKPVEFNPNFLEEMKERTGGKGVILMCEAGGTLKPSVNFMTGKTSRSLKAAYRVLTEGDAPGIAHLEGGMYGWWQQQCPVRGEYDLGNVGRTPNSAVEPTGLPESPVKAEKERV